MSYFLIVHGKYLQGASQIIDKQPGRTDTWKPWGKTVYSGHYPRKPSGHGNVLPGNDEALRYSPPREQQLQAGGLCGRSYRGREDRRPLAPMAPKSVAFPTLPRLWWLRKKSNSNRKRVFQNSGVEVTKIGERHLIWMGEFLFKKTFWIVGLLKWESVTMPKRNPKRLKLRSLWYRVKLDLHHEESSRCLYAAGAAGGSHKKRLYTSNHKWQML